METRNQELANTHFHQTPPVNQVFLELHLHLLNTIPFMEKFSNHLRIKPFASAFLTKLLVASFSDGETDVK